MCKLVTGIALWLVIATYFKAFWSSGENAGNSPKENAPTIGEVLYFMFISFTTIGLGDYSPSVESRWRITRHVLGQKYVGSTMLIQMFLLTLGMAFTGTILSEAATWLQRYWERQERERRMMLLFYHLDQDGDGSLSPEEIREALTNYAELEERDIEVAIASLDRNSDGKVELEEFIRMANTVGRLTLKVPQPSTEPQTDTPRSVV